MSNVQVPKWLFSKYPLVCTRCGGTYEHNDKRLIYPYPPDEYLCKTCFNECLGAGLNRLNKVLAGQPLTKEDWQTSNKTGGVDTLDSNVKEVKS